MVRTRSRRRSHRSSRINPRSDGQRTGLRSIGVIVFGIGAIFTVVGLGSFFSSMGSFGSPDKFWCAFVGLPLMAIGGRMLMLGYMGTVARYAAGELAPVATDTLNYVADQTRGSIHNMSSAVATGIRDAAASQEDAGGMQVACASCSHPNDVDARFCDQCGAGMPGPNTCGQCAKTNDPDARFCDGCGSALG